MHKTKTQITNTHKQHASVLYVHGIVIFESLVNHITNSENSYSVFMCCFYAVLF